MNKSSSPTQILAQITQIKSMEFGKLCEYQRAGRSEECSTYYRLQIWDKGKNHTRHVRPEELVALRQALAGYARFCELTEQYAQIIVAQTRAQAAQGIKKKIQPYSRHCRKKSNDSSTRS